MTRLYLDTEFNGQGGELISMALVSPGGHHWYGIRAFALTKRAVALAKNTDSIEPWVVKNVLPKLNRDEHNVYGDLAFRISLHGFLSLFDDPEIICDWNADAAHFAEWLAGPTYETSLDYACRITILKTPPSQPVSENPHNALADAEALMRWNEDRLRTAA